MRQKWRYIACAYAAMLLMVVSGCSTSIIRGPLSASNDHWDMELVKLAAGPDQYWTAGGYRRPQEGKRYVWATVRLRNALKTPLVIRLDRIYLYAAGARKRPCVVDAGCFITVTANRAPKLGAGETITRRLAYMLPRGAKPERMVLENGVIVIPAPAGR